MTSSTLTVPFFFGDRRSCLESRELGSKGTALLVTLQDMHLYGHEFDLHGSSNSSVSFSLDEYSDSGIDAFVKGVRIGRVCGSAALKLRKLLIRGWAVSTFFMRYLSVQPWETTAELLVVGHDTSLNLQVSEKLVSKK